MIAPEPLAASVRTEEDVLRYLRETVSATRLTLFLQCRLKFYFRYVLQLEKPKSAALHVGGSVHAALRAWNKARWRKAPLTTEQLRSEFLSAWENEDHAKVCWDGEEAKQRQMSWSLVETYLRETTVPPDEPPDAVEVPIEADLSPEGLPKLIGVLDLVQAGTIVDYKTSATTPNSEKAAHLNEIQVSSYAVLYREATGKLETGTEVHTLVKLKTPKLVVTPMGPVSGGQKARLFHLIESYVTGIERQDWIPSPGLQCAVCEYFDECRLWQ